MVWKVSTSSSHHLNHTGALGSGVTQGQDDLVPQLVELLMLLKTIDFSKKPASTVAVCQQKPTRLAPPLRRNEGGLRFGRAPPLL